MLLTTIILPLNIARISLFFMRETVRINFFVYIRWLQCKVKNMVESWYYWQWRCSGWVFDFNIWFASANIRPKPYFSKFILMYKSDFHWPVHQSLHPNCTIKSLIVNPIFHQICVTIRMTGMGYRLFDTSLIKTSFI